MTSLWYIIFIHVLYISFILQHLEKWRSRLPLVYQAAVVTWGLCLSLRCLGPEVKQLEHLRHPSQYCRRKMLQELTWPTQMLKRCQKSCYNRRCGSIFRWRVFLCCCFVVTPPWKLRCPYENWCLEYVFFLKIDGWMNVCWKGAVFSGVKNDPKKKVVSHAKTLVCRRVGEIYIYIHGDVSL